MAAHEVAAPQQPKQARGSVLEMVDRLYRGCALMRAHASEADRDQLAQAALEMETLSLMLAGKDEAAARDTLRKRYEGRLRRAAQSGPEDVFQIYMNAVTGAFDPHTSYLSPRNSENFNIQMRLSLEGIGAVLQRQEEFVVIRTIVPGGPASKSGKVQVGDRVVAVGQGDSGPMTDVVGWRIDDVVDLIRGKKGTKVRLDVIPADAGTDGAHKLVSLVRDKVKLEEQAASKKIIDAGGRCYGFCT